MQAFPFGRVVGATNVGGVEIPHGKQQSLKKCLWLHSKTWPSNSQI